MSFAGHASPPPHPHTMKKGGQNPPERGASDHEPTAENPNHRHPRHRAADPRNGRMGRAVRGACAMRVALYCRKSCFTGRGESVENQAAMCRAYAQLHYPDAEICCYTDEGYSAKTTDRPAFREMLAENARSAFAAIICYRLDRFSRSVRDFAQLAEALAAGGTALICVREQFDTSSPAGRAMMYMTSVFAQLERETLAERVRDNMHQLARSGRWLGGTPPLGYAVQVQTATGADGRVRTQYGLRPDAEKLRIAAAVYQTFRQTEQTSEAIAQIARTTGRTFSPTGLREVLRNPVYCAADAAARDYFASHGAAVCFDGTHGECGLMRYNHRDYTRPGAPRRPMTEWIIAAGIHPPIVSGAEWVRVQQILDRAVPRPRHTAALGAGALTCARCGAPLRVKARPDGTFDYICAMHLRAAADCPTGNLNGAAADRALAAALDDAIDGWSRGTDSPLRAWRTRLTLPEQRMLLRDARVTAMWDGAVLTVTRADFAADSFSGGTEGDFPSSLQ